MDFFDTLELRISKPANNRNFYFGKFIFAKNSTYFSFLNFTHLSNTFQKNFLNK
jgi:hypothetical protein